MSDKSRSNYSNMKKNRPRPVLVVSNPAPEEEPSSDDSKLEPSATPLVTPFPNYQPRPPRPLPSPGHPLSSDRPHPHPAQNMPPPLTTIIPPPRHYPPRSGPVLSSPSSTSSPAFDSTPPPSTPNQAAPSIDFPNEGMIRSDTQPMPIPGRIEAPSTSMSPPTRIVASPPRANLPPTNHTRHSSSNGRMSDSPTISTPDTNATPYAQVLGMNPMKEIKLLVTADAENFSTVDVSGAMTAAYIKERIFSKLKISDEVQPTFSIYRTEIGQYALGEALTDDQLVHLYREKGDDKGTIKLLVSHTTAFVHETPQDNPLLSPTVNTIPPPALPGLFAPLNPQRNHARSRSRHGSQSSASEHQNPEAYDASISDDNDTADPDSRRATIRAPLPHSRATNPSTPYRPPSPVTINTSDYTSLHRGAESPIPPLDNPVMSVLPTTPLAVLPRNRRYPSDRSRSQASGAMDSPDHTLGEGTISPFEGHLDLIDGVKRQPGLKRRDSRSQRQKDAQLSHSKRTDHSGYDIHGGSPEVIPRNDRLPTVPRTGGSHFLPPRTGAMSRDKKGQPVPKNWIAGWKEAERPEPKPNSPSRGLKITKSLADLRKPYSPSRTLLSAVPSSANSSSASRPSTGNSSVPGAATHQYRPNAIDIPGATPGINDEASISRSYDGQRHMVSPVLHPVPRPNMSPSTPTSSLYGTNSSYRLPVDDHALPNRSEYGMTASIPQSRPQYGIPPQPSYIRDDPSRSPRHWRGEQQVGISSAVSAGTLGRGLRTTPPPPSPAHVPQDHSTARLGQTNHSLPVPNLIDLDDSPERSSTHTRWTKFVDEDEMEGTLMPGAVAQHSSTPTPPLPPPPSSDVSSGTLVPTFVGTAISDDGSLDDFWSKVPAKDSQASKPQNDSRPPLSIETKTPTPPSSSRDNIFRSTTNFPEPPNFLPPPRRPPNTSKPKGERISGFDYENTWATRPPPEDLLEKLEDFFPGHDVDQPVIESGGASPTTSENPTVVPHRSKHKKSIRVVAEEAHKTGHRLWKETPAPAPLRKRTTKLWGSRLEELTTERGKFDHSPHTRDQSPGGAAKPIFRWVRGQLIGQGTYGKVYLALNATNGEMIAVKQVEMPYPASDKSDSRQVTVVEALKLESEHLKDLDHSNIVQYLGFEETPTFLSIFLEYVPGGSIASCLRKHGKFDEEVTKSFTSQILSGLEYLHGRGILHRDLKADNILVETSGVCKISDFGISKRTDDINGNGNYTLMQGTVFWMAPEVIDSQKGGYNSKIDIWSVGCVVYEMWTGQRPWIGWETMPLLLHLYQTKECPPVPPGINLSPLADDFRQLCFKTDPNERPSAAELRKHRYLELQPGWIFDGFS